MSIVVSGLTKRYGAQVAVNDISFSIKSGEIVGFIGPNGAGKSTTMKVLTGCIQNYRGAVEINGKDIRTHKIDVQRNTGYLPEHNPLYLDMYVKEYLSFVAGIYKVENKKAHIDEMVETLGLTKEYKKRIQALSKGYRQRVGLASALIHDPSVLILDEPTTGLDPNQIVEIRNLIAKIGSNKTILLSTHIMQEVEAICDRVIIIDNGLIVADGSASSVASGTSKETILVEFENAADRSAIEALDGVTAATPLEGNKFLVESVAGRDLRKDIFAWAVRVDNAVLTMQRQEKSLEIVFRELTDKR